MNIIYLILLFLHGLVHTLGFLQSFGLVNFKDLTLSISKPTGVFWLFAAILFFITAILFVLDKKWWLMIGFLAVVLSQILIISAWHDAKFGTFLNLLVLFAVVLGYGDWNFEKQIHKETTLLLSKQGNPENTLITKRKLEALPHSVQTWLNNTGIIGKEPIQTVYLKQKGLMKLKPEQREWSEAKAEQFITTDKPGFIWNVKMDMIPLVNTKGRDLFMDGNGEMQVKIASLIPVVHVGNNPKLNQSALQRYLLELPWYPTAALSPYITWESINEHTAKATLTYKGTTGSATYYFNQNGDLAKVSAMRYKDSDENAKLLECIGEVQHTKVISGLKIPTKFNVSWMLDNKLFTWYKLEIYDVKFD